eukprot:5511408-Pyramimonas_sp.AAC.1
MTKARGGSHGVLRPLRCRAYANQRLNCGGLFAPKDNAKQHAQASRGLGRRRPRRGPPSMGAAGSP